MYETAWWGHMWIQPYNYLTNKKLKISSPFYSRISADKTSSCGSADT
jgi:hypothetical protein